MIKNLLPSQNLPISTKESFVELYQFQKRLWNVVLGCNLKNDRIISVHFQGKPFNIIVIQVYAPTTNAEEAKVEWFTTTYETL